MRNGWSSRRSFPTPRGLRGDPALLALGLETDEDLDRTSVLRLPDDKVGDLGVIWLPAFNVEAGDFEGVALDILRCDCG